MLAMFGAPGWVELTIVGGIVLLLFGNRLPSVMRSLGQGITEFKRGIKTGEDDDANANLKDQRESDS
jgi:sec-independent protein translocase protein TatA